MFFSVVPLNTRPLLLNTSTPKRGGKIWTNQANKIEHCIICYNSKLVFCTDTNKKHKAKTEMKIQYGHDRGHEIAETVRFHLH